MIRRPSRSPLFPYTTLFPSQAEDGIRDWSVTGAQTYAVFCLRREADTYEPQYPTKLVCRLLLQKKNSKLTDRVSYRGEIAVRACRARRAFSQYPSHTDIASAA